MMSESRVASSESGRFTVRAYAPGDEAAILDLFARSFPHAPLTLERWRWRYADDPFGNGRISLAFDDGKLVGHYAGYPVPFVDGGRALLAHQIGDTMTDPAVRHIGRGPSSILGRTALHFYSTFCEGQVAFNYGFNVANIQKFSLRFLRSDRVEPVPYRVLARTLPRLSRIERLAKGWRFVLVKEAGAEFDEFFGRVARDYVFLARRDAMYLRWRYAGYPLVAIRKWGRLVGWIVFRIRENRFSIGDLLIDRRFPDALDAVLRHLLPMYPVEIVEGWFPPRPEWLDLVLREAGFELRPEPQDLSLMCVPFERLDAVARMREALYYTMGDSDLF